MPGDGGVEHLAQRLIALRADIDEILAQLAKQGAVALMPLPVADREPAAEATAAFAEAVAIEAATADTMRALADPATDGEADDTSQPVALEASAADETSPQAETTEGADQITEPAAAAFAAAPEAPIVSEQMPIAAAPEDAAVATAEASERAADDLGEIAAPDVDLAAVAPVDAEAADARTPAPSHDAISAQTAADTEAQVEATTAQARAELDANRLVTSAAELGGPGETAAAAEVIPITSHARKQKGGLAAGSAASTTGRVRSGRRFATKVAASILALLAAATLLMVADRVAQGGVPQPPWLPQLPSYVPAGASWPSLGKIQAADRSGAADALQQARPLAQDNMLLQRYLEIWPSGS
jgi:hypothetical protein